MLSDSYRKKRGPSKSLAVGFTGLIRECTVDIGDFSLEPTIFLLPEAKARRKPFGMSARGLLQFRQRLPAAAR
jgi:hypothetical protein